jgi:alpha-L-fucosidase
MKINGEAIYNTRPISPYKEGKICFTSLSDGTVYAIYLADEDETEPPAKVWLTGFTPKPGAQLQLLGSSTPLTWERIGKGVLINISDAVRKKAPSKYAWTIKIAP